MVSGQAPERRHQRRAAPQYAEFPQGAATSPNGLVRATAACIPRPRSRSATRSRPAATSGGRTSPTWASRRARTRTRTPSMTLALPGTEPGYDTAPQPVHLLPLAARSRRLRHRRPGPEPAGAGAGHAGRGPPRSRSSRPGVRRPRAERFGEPGGDDPHQHDVIVDHDYADHDWPTTTAPTTTAPTTTASDHDCPTTTAPTTTAPTTSTSPAAPAACPAGPAGRDRRRECVPAAVGAADPRLAGLQAERRAVIAFAAAGQRARAAAVRTGALVLSRYARRGKKIRRAYRPYSLLRSVEDMLGYTPLAHARSAPSFAAAV